jgi:hypothetical protein
MMTDLENVVILLQFLALTLSPWNTNAIDAIDVGSERLDSKA